MDLVLCPLCGVICDLRSGTLVRGAIIADTFHTAARVNGDAMPLVRSQPRVMGFVGGPILDQKAGEN
jgi:hypothetical protein